MSQAMIDALRDPSCFDHAVGAIEIFETHISWIVLTGEYAYKIKKPLELGNFLDFSTLERRRRCCEEEVRLNRRLAPDLYLGVVPIVGTPEAPRVAASGTPIEHAIKMRQFSNRELLSHLQASGELSQPLIDDLVDQLVRFHAEAERLPATDALGSRETIAAVVEREFRLIDARLTGEHDRRRLEHLETWANETLARLGEVFDRRHREGFVRETHGDVHLGNAVRLDGRVVLFDGIEFNETLRWNDVGSDLAFLLMDLEARNEEALARHALNRYLECSGDHELVRLLPFYKLYRALVRAKVAMLRYHQPDLHPTDRQAIMADFRRYLALAEHYAEFHFPYLVIGVGVSGSGKSRFTGEMIRRLGGVRLRSDVERKRLHGFDPQARTEQAGVDIYTPEATERTYRHLAALTGMVLDGGLPVCIDATCLRQAQRDRLRHQAEARGLPVLLVSFEADDATLRARIEKRARRGGDPSEAGLAVLERQQRLFEPFTDEERLHLVHLDTTRDNANLTLVGLIQEHLRLQ
ncbi:AAA family ATPase [Modicisalibacter tunisiensis]|uniref:AAA family ATPase n=1 Tax=Modicisalibacter tunisiensis TaxID=390637 RepID=A0ABS7WWB8_9GAMM|nr:bifunctional aminoglycoside phosphotransferase/ATP-binding protein [Modicisalibacter tunisiensis]MBZ9566896.1 AAA family ATPase [Modicisalibacter tunisiensis]